MEISKNVRKELDALSKEVFGTSSRWQKLVNKGYDELVTEEVTETTPAEKEGDEPTKKQVQVPVLTASGAKQYVRKHHTVESVKEFLGVQKIQLDLVRKQIAQLQEEAKAKQEEEKAKKEAEDRAKQIHQQLSGSAT